MDFLDAVAHDNIVNAALAETDDFIARGHAIITRNLDGATRLAQEYPAVAALLPAIRSALQELFDHLVSVPTLPHDDHAAAVALVESPAARSVIADLDLGPLVGGAPPDPLIDTSGAAAAAAAMGL